MFDEILVFFEPFLAYLTSIFVAAKQVHVEPPTVWSTHTAVGFTPSMCLIPFIGALGMVNLLKRFLDLGMFKRK